MTPIPLTMSPNYIAVVRGIRELHRLAVSGLDDSTAADAVRDATDEPWRLLSEAERRRATTLSEDLYSIEVPSASGPHEAKPQAQAGIVAAIEARQRGEWDAALEMLRRWSGDIAPALLSYLRGSIWQAAGDPDAAALFFEHASALEPTPGSYLGILMNSFVTTDPTVSHAPNVQSP